MHPRRFSVQAFLLIAVASACSVAQPGSVQTIDASRIDAVVSLDAPWRFHAGDDPRYADPSFDDSSWPLLKPKQTFASAGLPVSSGGYSWARIHLHLVHAGPPLGIAIERLGGLPYAVYANGNQIAVSRTMGLQIAQSNPPFPIALPPAADIVVAIRFFHPRPFVLWEIRTFPLQAVLVGPLGAMADATELARNREFDNNGLSALILILILLAFVPFALALYLAQRAHSEYLWLAIYFLFVAGFEGYTLALQNGLVPWTNLNVFLWRFIGFIDAACSLEFVMRFTRPARRTLARPLQILFLMAPLVGLAGFYRWYEVLLIVCMLLWFGFLAFQLLLAYRHHLAEAKLLLTPYALVILAVAYQYAALFFPSLVPLPPRFHAGRLGFDLQDLASVLFFVGIVAVVLYRFIRVTKDEQRSAAELEAARTVQQVLIPDEIPTVPGFSLQSVYKPAGLVGGDFFQILPITGGGVLVVIGDVSGKGMPAAMTVSLLVGTVRTLAHYTQSPGEILAAMNTRMMARSHGGFTTCLVLRAGTDGTLTIANAGHIAPYLAGKELPLENGLPLGLSAEATYTEATFQLPLGQQLTILTDGVVEARDKTGALFGFERAAALSFQPAEAIAEAAQAFGQDDDITVLTLARIA